MSPYISACICLTLSFITLVTAGSPLQLVRKSRSIFGETTESVTRTTFPTAESGSRLPLDVIPSEYDIHIIPILDQGIPNFERWSAYGSVKIRVTCINVTNRITLHAAGIEINQEDVKVLEGQRELQVSKTEVDEPNDFYHIDLEENLTSNTEYTIEITRYVAQVRDLSTVSLKLGLYRAEYTNPQGEQKWIAITQFATIGFRRFCPGFDEPDLKATFTIHIGHGPDYNAASNSDRDLEGTDDPSSPLLPPEWMWAHFKPTVVMSSYLVALVVSDFVREESSDVYTKPVSILGPPHLIRDNQGGVFAAEESAKILKSYDTIFGPGLEYPMHKMDSVAAPRDYFTFGAMENWGLVIYKDDLLMYYPGISSEDTRYRVASLLSHELTHQWFGNLVTNKWWSHAWLHEGFATYISFLGVSETLAEYEAEKRILYEAVQVALAFDAGPSSHPVINTATPEEVASMSIFDSITYEKGCSLIRMMEGFLGKEALINGLQLYLKNIQHTRQSGSYKGAVQDDLFGHLQAVATDLPTGKTIKSVMDTWTLKKGFPLIRVQRGNANTIYISQERYTNNANPNQEIEVDELWEVPIAIATATEVGSFTDPRPKFWLNKDASLMPYRADNLDTSKLILLNPNVHGFYRVLYDTHFARLIREQLEVDHTVISSLNRGQLFDDYFRFAEEGYASYESALAFPKYLAKESDHAVWTPLLGTLAKLLPHFMGSAPGMFEPFQRYFSPKFGGALEQIGWSQGPDERGSNVTLRASLLDWACTLEHEKCAELANNYTTRWMAKPDENPIPVDLQNVLYCAGVAYGPDAVFDFVYTKYTESLTNNQDIDSETVRLASALTCSQSNLKLLELVRGTINGDLIPRQHMRLILEGVGSTSYGRDLVYGVLLDEWRSISEYWSGSPGNPDASIIANVVTALTTYQNSADQVAKVLIEDSSSGYAILPQLGAAIEKIKANGLWLRERGLTLRQWLIENTNFP